MKKFKLSTSIIIIVVSVAVIVGAFLLISNHLAKNDEDTDIAISSVQNVLLRNMDSLTSYIPPLIIHPKTNQNILLWLIGTFLLRF